MIEIDVEEVVLILTLVVIAQAFLIYFALNRIKIMAKTLFTARCDIVTMVLAHKVAGEVITAEQAKKQFVQWLSMSSKDPLNDKGMLDMQMLTKTT